MAGHETVAEAVLTLSEVQVSSGFTSWRGERELLKERRKSLTPVITALSPSGHIRSAERLTDPAGKSFTARTPPQRSHERSFLSTCLHFSDVPTLKVHTLQLFSRPSRQEKNPPPQPSVPWRGVIKTHLRTVSLDPALLSLSSCEVLDTRPRRRPPPHLCVLITMLDSWRERG